MFVLVTLENADFVHISHCNTFTNTQNSEIVQYIHPIDNWKDVQFRVFALDLQNILVNAGYKHVSLQAKNLMNRIPSYSPSAVKKCTKNDLPQTNKILYWQSN